MQEITTPRMKSKMADKILHAIKVLCDLHLHHNLIPVAKIPSRSRAK